MASQSPAKIRLRWRIVVGTVAAAILGISTYSYVNPPIWVSSLDPSKIRATKGFLYIVPYNVVPIFWLPTDRYYPTAGLKLLEDGHPLGPSGALHAGIAEQGKGRYSYWGNSVWHNQLYFSASDNSDPRSNGRTYQVIHPLYISPVVAAVVLIGLILSATGIRHARLIAWKAAPAVLATGIGLAIAITSAELFLRSDFVETKLVGAIGGYDNFPIRLRPTLNSLGYRDHEHVKAKPNGVARILVLGDSMTFGHGVADNELWSRRLQELAGPKVEVISIAENGWSTEDELYAFRHQGAGFDPDMVVIGVVDNDLQPPQWDPSGQQAEWVIFSALTDKLILFHWLDYAINRLGDAMGWRYSYSQWLVDTYDPAKSYFPRWQRTVAEFGEALRQKGLPGYAFVLISPIAPSNEGVKKRYEVLQREFEKNGFRSVNLQGAFVREFGPDGGKDLWALPNDPHPGSKAQRLFAKEIWHVLEPAVRALSGTVR
jgi:lysophospholipase L1-like esterase